MKNILISISIVFALLLSNCAQNSMGSKSSTENNSNMGNVIILTDAMFKETIFDYEKNKTWKYEGETPVIIDFYATWCGPCKQLSPLVEEIAKEYSGKIIVYKVDVDKEKNLAQKLGVQNLPTLVFIPKTGQPQATMGFMPKDNIVKIVNDVLLVK